eukprot:5981794-Prymnesium_polylepis.1
MAAPLLGVEAPEEVCGFLEQGLAQEWNFNQHESLRNMRHAVELAPTCAVCLWALARALGPNTNRGVHDQAEFNDAAERAVHALASSRPSLHPSKLEVLVQTIQPLRIPPGSNHSASMAARAAHASAACDAADRWAGDHEEAVRDDDLDALCVDALMAASPWDYYTRALMSDGERTRPVWPPPRDHAAPHPLPRSATSATPSKPLLSP